jgi:UDPglucose 6-dehydrogenase
MGKIGLPIALVLEQHGGHTVVGYDSSPQPVEILYGRARPPQEAGLAELIASTDIAIAKDPAEVVRRSDGLVLVAVQTPHAPEYGGEVPQPPEPRDFEYGYLVQAVRDVARAAADQRKWTLIVVVSTCLPGTVDRVLRPLLNDFTELVYNPAFIAMGTTVADFLNPEFVLLGTDFSQGHAVARVKELYATLHSRPVVTMSVTSAELTKVAYNVFISMKIVFANMLAELAEGTGADCDDVAGALALATDRVVSPKYLSGGMGDGGHCHPRDLIALDWLSQRLELSANVAGFLADAREQQSRGLAQTVHRWARQTGMAVCLLGKAYKPESDLTGGSPALLLAHQLRTELGLEVEHWDPVTDGDGGAPSLLHAKVYVITTRTPCSPLRPSRPAPWSSTRSAASRTGPVWSCTGSDGGREPAPGGDRRRSRPPAPAALHPPGRTRERLGADSPAGQCGHRRGHRARGSGQDPEPGAVAGRHRVHGVPRLGRPAAAVPPGGIGRTPAGDRRGSGLPAFRRDRRLGPLRAVRAHAVRPGGAGDLQPDPGHGAGAHGTAPGGRRVPAARTAGQPLR